VQLGFYAQLHRGMTVQAIDLKRDSGRAALTELLTRADEVRKELRSGLGRWRRVRSDISLRPFLDRRPRPVGQAGRRRLTLPRARKTATS